MSDYDAAFAAAVGGPKKGEVDPYDAVMQQVAPKMADAPASVGLLAPAPSQQPPQPTRDKFDLRGDGYDRIQNYNGKNAIGGTVSGLGAIGATVLRPFESAEANEQRRAKLDRGMQEFLGADPNATDYKTNKVLSQVVATAPVGGVLAKGLSAIPGVAKALPTLLPAIQSGGMSANGLTGLQGALARVTGGAINGAATAGMVNPSDAGTGMMLGGLFPLAVKAGGAIGDAVGSLFKGNPINPVLAQTAKESIGAGYAIPPNMVEPGLKNQVLESISGKQATQQLASVRNAATTEKLVRGDLGIAPDVPLTKATLENLRKTAGAAYGEVSALSPQAAADLEALKQARNDAQGWFNAYNRSASPADLAKAKQFRAQADQLETALEQHAQAAGKPELVPALRDARKEIAKSYTVERALNDAAGTVDARVLGRLYEKGKPLSDGMATAGKFASAFPTIAKTPQQIGSPAANNLKAGLALLMSSGGGGAAASAGLGGLATGGVGLALGAVPFVAPPVARSLMFSKAAQQGLVNQTTTPGLLSLMRDESLPLLYRGNGLLATSGQ
jgi:hypothetical protein